MMWLQLHGLQCLETVTAAAIAVVGGCAAAVAVVAAVAHTFVFTQTRNVPDVIHSSKLKARNPNFDIQSSKPKAQL